MYVRHVTEVKRCSNEGCSNGVIKGGGVCKRHGAYCNPKATQPAETQSFSQSMFDIYDLAMSRGYIDSAALVEQVVKDWNERQST
eukprot:scaffold625_cov169-Skeletonema_dohrnii-CCMP3373.AAC.17